MSGPEAASPPPESIETRLENLFSLDGNRLSGTVQGLLGRGASLEDAHEALQTAFVRCWQDRERLVEVENLRAFVYTAVLNASRDLQRRRRVRREVDLPPDELLPPASEALPEAEIAKRESVALVRREISLLAALDREVFLLRQNGELTYAEIAEATGMALGTVKTRMRRALAQLRKGVQAPDREAEEARMRDPR